MISALRVAVLQTASVPLDAEANARHLTERLDEAAREAPLDLAVFPELACTGYIQSGREKELGKAYIRCAQKIPGQFTEELGAAARRHGVYLIAGMCQAHDVIPATVYNAAVLIGPSGAVEGVYHKMHIPGEEKHYFYPGDVTDVFHTELGTIGIQICADLWHPELGRVQALNGAEVIVGIWGTPYIGAPPTMIEHITVARAIENKLFAVSCNAVGEQRDLWGEGTMTFFGRSAVADPFGRTLALAGDGEETIRACLDADVLLEQRTWHTVFRDRRPENYGLLVARFS